MDHIQFLIIGSLVVVSSESDNFIITPQSVNVTEGSTASFYCRFGAPLRTTWHINGTPWHQLYLANQTIFRAGNYLDQGNRVFNLSMTALPSNNHSVIQCVVNYTIYSEPAILLIQGKLQQVEDLTIRIEEFSLVIQWMAPFSLIITSSTEVTYCVDVYNSTDQTLETSICGLNETQYRYEAMSDPSPCDGVDIYVIPVNSAGNGSRTHIIGTFYNEPDSFVISDHDLTIIFTSKNELLIEVSIIGDFTACNCFACIRMLTEFSTKRCYNALCDNNEVLFLMNESNRNKYVLTIVLNNTAGSSTSNNSLEFSTHDVQSISINSTVSPGTVKAGILFLMNSTARGCLVILFQAHHYTGYFAIEKDSDRERVDQHIEYLPKGRYTVLGYDIRSCGFPHHPIPAVILYNVTLNEGSSRNQESAFLSELTVDADGAGNICINCTQSDALGCVVLLHPVNDLSNITVREVNRHLQQPYCIHVGRNIFSVAVFEWKKDGFLSFQPAVFKITTFDQPTTDILLYVSIGAGIMVITMIMILGITIIIIVIKYRKHSKANDSSPKRTGALTLASTTELANQHPNDPTPNNMTESQYESIDGVRINAANDTRQSGLMRRETQEKSPPLPLQEPKISDDEFDDPNYSIVKSFKGPQCTRKELWTSDSKDASRIVKNGVKYHYEDVDDLWNEMCPAETPMHAQRSENAEAQKVKHVWDNSHTYSVVNKRLKTHTKCHEETMDDVMDKQSASIDIDSCISESKDSHTYSETFTKAGATKSKAEMDERKSKVPLKTEMDDPSKTVIINEEELCKGHPTNTETQIRDPSFITVSKNEYGDLVQDDEPPTVPPFQN